MELNETERQIVVWLQSLPEGNDFIRFVAYSPKLLAYAIKRGEHRESDDA